MDDQTKFDRLEAAMAAIRADRDSWAAYRDAEADSDVLKRINERNAVAASDAEVQAAKQKATDAMMAWHEGRAAARAALDLLLEPYGVTRCDLRGLCQ